MLWAPPGLQVLETCVKNCGHRFHVLVASQDFVEGVLVRTILPKNNPPTIVHDKVLNLIQVSAGGRAERGGESSVLGGELPSRTERWGRLGRLLIGRSKGGETCQLWALLWRGCLGDAVKGPAVRDGIALLWGRGGELTGASARSGYR